MESSKQNVGLFGGSFDPVHNGHLSVAHSFLESAYISELWILLTPEPPHKVKKPTSEYSLRMEMLRAAFGSMDGVKISDVENKLPRPSYTIQTVKYLTEKYPDKKFSLCIGEDSLREFKDWKEWKKILQYCKLLVARRPSDKPLELDPIIAEKTHFVTHQPVEISSTCVRNKIKNGEEVANFIPEQVNQIIKEANLYK